jgi:arginyl-tRNA synthetase
VPIEDKLGGLLKEALNKAIGSGRLTVDKLPPVIIERPRDKAHGDWASNIAMILAKQAGMAPRDVAKTLLEELDSPEYLAETTIAGPGFINFRLSHVWLQQSLAEIGRLGDGYGRARSPSGARVQIEFVSANPVGPMHVGHGRWAAVGDSLARLLEAVGDQVAREFYVNDWGNQMRMFGASVAARYREILGRPAELPEDGYQGRYIVDIAQEIINVDGDRYLELDADGQAAIFTERAYVQVLEHIKETLESMDVVFDVWFSERSLHESGRLTQTLALLEEKGLTYRSEGALWFRTTDLGDDKDRVLIRENGDPTYFAADIAYHNDKFSRGFTGLIDIWGADHHGYVKRMKAAAAGLGFESDRLEIIIGQLVNLFSGGRPIRMSKRTGEMVTLEELLAEVGKDAARYFFLMRSTDTSLDFDIELAKSHTAENPVYYVQYAHARICSVLRLAAESGMRPAGESADLSLLTEPAETALLRELADAPSVIMRAAAARAPYRLTKYLETVAAAFHQFYHQCRIVSDDKDLSLARLALVDGTRQVLKNVLGLIGVSAPEKM